MASTGSTATAGTDLRTWRQAQEPKKSLDDTAEALNELMSRAGTDRRTDAAQLSRIERGIELPGLTLAACIESLTGVRAAAWILVA